MVPVTLKRADIILAIVIVAVAAVFVAGRSLGLDTDQGAAGARKVVIELNSKHFRTVPFSQVTGVMTVDVPAGRGHTVAVEIAGDGRARVSDSDCPDKVCVRTGWIERPGEAIVCLPNRVVVKIQGGPRDTGPTLDGIAY
ncbi:MAG: NusG domain II-containing protein [Bacteroidota bacterium]